MLNRLRDLTRKLLPAGADAALQRLQGDLAGMDAAGLRRTRADISRQVQALDGVAANIDRRLAQALAAVPLPQVPRIADWSGRAGPLRTAAEPAGHAGAAPNTQIAPDVTLFHDCPRSEVILRQIPQPQEADPAPFALIVEVMAFEGSFLSLAIALPETAVAGLRQSHIVQLDLKADIEHPVPIFARLNIQHGPNHEDQVREVPFDPRGTYVEFDLAYLQMNEKRVENVWVDLIFDQPAWNRFVIRDLYLHRRPRAEI